MSSALLVQVNDLGAWFHSLARLRMPAISPVTLRWAERGSLRLVSSAIERSTRLSQLELAGVKCRWKRGCRTSQSLTAGVLRVAELSRTRCRSRPFGTAAAVTVRERG